MPARSLWTGTVSFGLVAIPVGLVSAVRSSRTSFRMLHDKDKAPLERKMYCQQDDNFIHPEHIVKGYEYEKDHYITVRQEELAALASKRSQTIEIIDFVDLDAIDPLYYDRPYYLAPQKGADKPYSLLVNALEETRKAGISKFVMRDREYLVAIRAIEGVLCLLMLHYQADIVEADDLVTKDAAVDNSELQLMEKTIAKMTGKFEPERYHDKYDERVLRLVHEKQEKHEVFESEVAEEEYPEEEEMDLIAALEESLSKSKQKK